MQVETGSVRCSELFTGTHQVAPLMEIGCQLWRQTMNYACWFKVCYQQLPFFANCFKVYVILCFKLVVSILIFLSVVEVLLVYWCT